MSIWISAHIYYTRNWENFIKDHVYNIVSDLENRQLIDAFFFVRYFEQGPHIRLRLRAKNKKAGENVRNEVRSFFKEIFETAPSTRYGSSISENWHPNNSIQFIPYKPEVKRYGGTAALAIAEQQFHASSCAIIKAIQQCKDWAYSTALITAVQLHLCFTFAMDMDEETAAGFYKNLYLNNLSLIFPEEENPEIAVEKHNAAIMTSFQNAYNNQEQVLLYIYESTWSALRTNKKTDEKWLDKWVLHSRGIYQKLQELLVSKKIELPFPPSHYLPLLYSRYMHMTNNRLGIKNQDEPFIAYLIFRLFSNSKIRKSAQKELH